MKSKNSREYIHEILLAVRRLPNGAKADSIVDYVRRQFLKNKSQPSSITSKIKRDLQSAVETGLLRHANGKYHLTNSMQAKRSAGRVRRGSSSRRRRRRRSRRGSRSRSRSRSRRGRRSGSRRPRSGSRIDHELLNGDEQNQSNNGNEDGEHDDCDPECCCDKHNYTDK